MSERYYDGKSKGFNELILVQLTMEEFVTKSVNLQRYVRYLKDKEAKLYWFITFLPPNYRINLNLKFPRPWMKQLGRLNSATFYLNKELN